MIHYRRFVYVLLSVFSLCLMTLFQACGEDEGSDEIENASEKFASCNQIVSARCGGYEGEHCLFGFKFGENITAQTGPNALGPKITGGVVTFSFQEENGVVDTHKQVDIPSESFDLLPQCAKSKIKTALAEWSSAASIDFEELDDNQDTDIKFFVASISTGGVGYPNYPESPCDQLAGHVILHPDFTSDCDVFYLYVLHEIGHALGLGHSARHNIMGTDIRNSTLTSLQSGDVGGIRQIYGER